MSGRIVEGWTAQFALMLLVATVVAAVARRFRVPYEVALVLTGLAIAAPHVFSLPSLDPGLLLFAFLPPLLFDASFRIDVRELRAVARPVALLAVPGVLLTAVLVGSAVAWLLGLPLATGLLFGSIVVWAVALLRGRSLAVALVVIGLVPIVPALIQGAFITSGGWIWQGRYALPVLVVALLALGLMLADATRALNARTAAILTGLAAGIWAICHVLAYVTSMQRYSVGAGVSWWDMLVAREWQPPGGIVPLLAVFTLVAAGAGVLGWRFALPRSVTPGA